MRKWEIQIYGIPGVFNNFPINNSAWQLNIKIYPIAKNWVL